MTIPTDLAHFVSPDALWLKAAQDYLWPIKSTIINYNDNTISFFNNVDKTAENILSFYAPDLRAAERKNASLPMMDGKDVVIILILYFIFILFSLLILKRNGSAASSSEKREKPVMEKIGPVFVLQAIYNIIQVVLCASLVYRVYDVYKSENYSFLCNKFNVPNTRMAEVTWAFYMLKFFDLFDTLFMVMRGNWRQISFLHVYHHSSVIYISWVNASVGYDGEIYYVVAFNSFVHVVMYSYYFMASLNMKLAKMMKMFVTQLQMIQFMSMVVHALYHIYNRNKCYYPLRVSMGYFFYVISLFLLFRNFSKKTYGNKVHNNNNNKIKTV